MFVLLKLSSFFLQIEKNEFVPKLFNEYYDDRIIINHALRVALNLTWLVLACIWQFVCEID